MKAIILHSAMDQAGINVARCLAPEGRWGIHDVQIHQIKQDSIFYDDADELECDIVIFATKHKAASGKKTLSLHFPGNLAQARFGGRERMLCMSAAQIGKHLFSTLQKLAQGSDYAATLEATHHGPICSSPCLFIEIGSTQEEWLDASAGKIIADTLYKGLSTFEDKAHPIVLGFGGTHYCQQFNKIQLRSDVAMSHIVPKYAVMDLDGMMIKQLVQMTDGAVAYALLDWKGMNSKEKKHLIPLLEQAGLQWKKTKEIGYS